MSVPPFAALYAGEYARDVKHMTGDKQGLMSRFIHKGAAPSSCTPSTGEAARSPDSQVHPESKLLGQPHNTTRVLASRKQQQSDAAMPNPSKLPRKGIGPMDRFLK